MSRARFLLLVLPIAAFNSACAQGVHVAPVMTALPTERGIAALRLRNERDRPVLFGVEVKAWTLKNGRDVLEPSRELATAPGAFAILPGQQQVVRLGVWAREVGVERAFRIVLREFSGLRAQAEPTDLEISLPTFVAPADARAALALRIERRGDRRWLLMRNGGDAHTRIERVDAFDAGPVQAPRYLLAGASAFVELPAASKRVRVVSSDFSTANRERIVDVA